MDEGIGLVEQPRPSKMRAGKKTLGKDHACKLVKIFRIDDDVFQFMSTEIYKRDLLFQKTLAFYEAWVMWTVLPAHSMSIAKA